MTEPLNRGGLGSFPQAEIPTAPASTPVLADGRWFITNISRGYMPDLADRVARANAAAGKTVEIHDEPIPDGMVMGSPDYKAAWAGDCQSLSIVGGYQDMSSWWRAFGDRPRRSRATTASSLGTDERSEGVNT